MLTSPSLFMLNMSSERISFTNKAGHCRRASDQWFAAENHKNLFEKTSEDACKASCASNSKCVAYEWFPMHGLLNKPVCQNWYGQIAAAPFTGPDPELGTAGCNLKHVVKAPEKKVRKSRKQRRSRSGAKERARGTARQGSRSRTRGLVMLRKLVDPVFSRPTGIESMPSPVGPMGPYTSTGCGPRCKLGRTKT